MSLGPLPPAPVNAINGVDGADHVDGVDGMDGVDGSGMVGVRAVVIPWRRPASIPDNLLLNPIPSFVLVSKTRHPGLLTLDALFFDLESLQQALKRDAFEQWS